MTTLRPESNKDTDLSLSMLLNRKLITRGIVYTARNTSARTDPKARTYNISHLLTYEAVFSDQHFMSRIQKFGN